VPTKTKPSHTCLATTEPPRVTVPRKSESKQPGVTLIKYEPTEIDCCNFHSEDRDSACGKPAITAVIVTDTDGHGVLLKLCRRHLSRLSILLIEELE
jgi:hypothetical protein